MIYKTGKGNFMEVYHKFSLYLIMYIKGVLLLERYPRVGLRVVL